MKYLAILAILIGFIGMSYAQSDNYSPSGRDYVPYTENYNIRFDSEGHIDYDLLIAKIMPGIFEKKLDALGANISTKDIVLYRGFQHAIYEPYSYNCGYAIDPEMNRVYWLEAAINSTHIQYADIYDDIPRDDKFRAGQFDCFAPLEIQVAERFLEEKSYFTADEEILAASAVKHYLRGNENLNKYQFTIGKFNFDYKDDDVVLSFCGKFEGRTIGSNYFSGILKKSGTDFGLQSSMMPLCAIRENPTLYDIKFQSDDNRDESLQSWKNIRKVDVHIKPDSVEKMLQRNYLYAEMINYNLLDYSSHMNLDSVDYRPESSSTVLTFVPSVQESYMKIRLPDNGVNYYVSYGNEEWHTGRLVGMSILVDGLDTPYYQIPYVRSPDAPYPQYFTDSIFRVPANSTSIEIILDVENYDFTPELDGKWRDYKPS